MTGSKRIGSRHYYSKRLDFAPYSVTAAVVEAMNLLLLVVIVIALAAGAAAAVAVADAYYLLMMALVVTWIEYVALEWVAAVASTA